MKNLLLTAAITLFSLPGLANLQSDADAVDFQTLLVGQSASVQIAISNVSTDAITGLSASINGNNKGEFSIAQCASVLFPGEVCTLTVTLTPQNPGRKKRTLSVDGSFTDINGDVNDVSATVALDGQASK